MKKAARDDKDKWLCFRKRLPFEAMPSDDLVVPWQDYVMMDDIADFDPFPLMIFEIKAVKAIEEAESKTSKAFKKKSFKSPEKNIGVKLSGGGIATAAFIMESLMKGTGLSMDELHAVTHCVDKDGDAFMTSLAEASKKRGRHTGGGRGEGDGNVPSDDEL